MAKKRSLLEQMHDSPQKDWTIEDVKKLCTKIGLGCRSPSSGSHYLVYSDALPGALSVPAHRPIKAVYIKQLVALASTHIKAKKGK